MDIRVSYVNRTHDSNMYEVFMLWDSSVKICFKKYLYNSHNTAGLLRHNEVNSWRTGITERKIKQKVNSKYYCDRFFQLLGCWEQYRLDWACPNIQLQQDQGIITFPECMASEENLSTVDDFFFFFLPNELASSSTLIFSDSDSFRVCRFQDFRDLQWPLQL